MLENYSQELDRHFQVTAFRPAKNQFACIFVDITERKRADDALRDSHERFLTVLDSIDATIFVADIETYEILFMNKYMVESFGGDLTGERCWEIFRGEPGPCSLCPNDKLLDENGKPTDGIVWQDMNPKTGKWYINHDHAMPDGGVIVVSIKNVEIDEKAAEKHPDLIPGHYVNLTISDTGHGISKDDIDRIFDPYFTTKEVERGTGMGLAVVHGIVKEHNGLILVDSEPGKGTNFNIFFPVIERKPVFETEAVERFPMGDERILFIDDEESIVKLVRQRLETLGYRVDAMTNPIEAVEQFRSQGGEFDLVITDMTMPKMTGTKLAKEILTIRSDIPIILCTGFSEKIDAEKAKEMGATGYIEKPFDQRELAFKVRIVLDEAKISSQG